MKKIIIPVFVLLVGCTAKQISQTVNVATDILNSETTGDNSLTESNVIDGLKEALVNGTTKGSAQASKTDGFYKDPTLKIPFPANVKKVEDKLRQLGMGSLVDDFVLSLNRGAEKAAGEAKPIFIDAVKAMTVQDAWGILKGDKNAATNYLRKTTTSKLETKFKPVIKTSLEAVNCTKYFTTVVSNYNKIPLVEKVNPDLEDYATQKTMDGLFSLIEKEEANIRENPIARTTELLQKVFGS